MPLTPNRPTVANRVFRFLKPSHVYTRIYRVSTGEEGERMKNKGVVEKKKKVENTVSRSSYSYSCTDSFDRS